MSWDLVVKDKFSAAHFLRFYKGKCEKMHGHTFEIEVYISISGMQLNPSGISIDFTELKEYLKTILPDHKVLNEEYDFSPSAESLSRFFFLEIKKKYPTVSKVIIWESDHAGAIYSED